MEPFIFPNQRFCPHVFITLIPDPKFGFHPISSLPLIFRMSWIFPSNFPSALTLLKQASFPLWILVIAF